jgi:DNA-directed RNA polymerase specialized sigma24 family protein
MAEPQSVTHWIGALKAGDLAAAQPLWERYFQQLVRFARQQLRNLPRRGEDEEDVALHAFDSFCRDVQHGRFPQLQDRDDLWRRLLLITAQKARDLVRHEHARKRQPAGAFAGEVDLEEIPAQEPTPELAAQVVEACRVLLARLPDERMRSVAVWKMEGYTNEEIATRLGCVPRTIQRTLRVIRSLWSEDGL